MPEPITVPVMTYVTSSFRCLPATGTTLNCILPLAGKFVGD